MTATTIDGTARDVTRAFVYSELATETATQARAAADRVRRHGTKLTEAILAIGQDLLAVKAMLDHGQFGSWLELECGMKPRTAQNYMRAAEAFAGKSATVAYLPPSAVYALAAAPTEARDAVVTRIEAGEHLGEGGDRRCCVGGAPGSQSRGAGSKADTSTAQGRRQPQGESGYGRRRCPRASATGERTARGGPAGGNEPDPRRDGRQAGRAPRAAEHCRPPLRDRGHAVGSDMPTRVSRRRRTAVHEAGHAVIGRKLRMVCGYATIKRDEDSSGHHIVADHWTAMQAWEEREIYRDLQQAAYGRIITMQAGGQAEHELLGDNAGGDGDDNYQCALMAQSVLRLDDDEAVAVLARLQRATAYLVKRHRTEIETVADRLALAIRVDGPELDAMVSGPLHRRPRSNPFLP